MGSVFQTGVWGFLHTGSCNALGLVSSIIRISLPSSLDMGMGISSGAVELPH